MEDMVHTSSNRMPNSGCGLGRLSAVIALAFACVCSGIEIHYIRVNVLYKQTWQHVRKGHGVAVLFGNSDLPDTSARSRPVSRGTARGRGGSGEHRRKGGAGGSVRKVTIAK